jgi:DnaJ-class molecular chaperone
MSHYETLKVQENASSDDIKKAYRKLASQHHPDKGGDTKEFQKIQEAYEAIKKQRGIK